MLLPPQRAVTQMAMLPVGAYRSVCSVNHGSGRVLSGGEAKQGRSVLHEDVGREMAEIRRTLVGVEVRGVVGEHGAYAARRVRPRLK